MPVYCVRLLPQRPSFPADITPQEGEAMQRHVGYWSSLAQAGHALLFGPVADPKGSWGLGVIEAEDEAALRGMLGQDPVILAALGFQHEVLPMPRGVITRAGL